jgi:hypothetical protein
MPIPTNISVPIVTNTTRDPDYHEAHVGDVLKVTDGTWSDSPTQYTYRWRHSDVAETFIEDNHTNVYKIRSGDLGHNITVRIAATNASGTSAFTVALDPTGSGNASIPDAAPWIQEQQQPEMTQVGGWVYDSLAPLAVYDKERGYPLAFWTDAIGAMFQPVLDLVDDPEILLDPNRTPVGWLPWLGQFVPGGGPIRPQRATGSSPETDSAYRASVLPDLLDPPSRRRGTVPAIVEVVQRYLVAPRTVFTVERQGGNMYVGTISVLSSQIAAGHTVAEIQAAVNKVAPAGRIITVSAITGSNWQALRDTHTDWADVRSTFTDWAEVRSNPTKQ